MSDKISKKDWQHNPGDFTGEQAVGRLTPEQEDRLKALLAGTIKDPFDPLHAKTEIMIDLAVVSVDTGRYIKNAPAYMAAIDRFARDLAAIEGCGIYSLTSMIDDTGDDLTFYALTGGARCTN